MILSGIIMVSPQSSIILTDISSDPLDFPEFRFLSMLFSLAVVLNTMLWGVLKLIMDVHFVAKELLNAVALSLQLTINLLFISRGGIFGALHLFSSLLIIFQYDFWLVWGSVSSTPRSFKCVFSH